MSESARPLPAHAHAPPCAPFRLQELQEVHDSTDGPEKGAAAGPVSPARRAQSALGLASERRERGAESRGGSAEVVSRVGTAATASSLHSIGAALSGKLARLEELEARLANGDGDKLELDQALAEFFDADSGSPGGGQSL